MIVRKFRLPSSVVFQHPLVVHEKEFVMKAQKNNESCNRFGFVVGKSVDKLATTRNQIKRLYRAHVEQAWLQASGSYDVLFICKAASKTTHQSELFQKIDSSLQKAGLV